MKTIPTNDWWDVKVRDLTQPVEQLETVDSDEPLLEVVQMLERKQVPSLVVLRSGALIGLLEKASILQLLQNQAEAKPV